MNYEWLIKPKIKHSLIGCLITLINMSEQNQIFGSGTEQIVGLCHAFIIGIYRNAHNCITL